MSLSSALYAYLKNISGVSALVATRIYPLILPQDPTLPALTYQMLFEVRGHTLSGAYNSNTTVQIDCYATTYTSAVALAVAVTSALDAYAGTMNSEQRVMSCFLKNRQDFLSGDELAIDNYRIILQFALEHVPTA